MRISNPLCLLQALKGNRFGEGECSFCQPSRVTGHGRIICVTRRLAFQSGHSFTLAFSLCDIGTD